MYGDELYILLFYHGCRSSNNAVFNFAYTSEYKLNHFKSLDIKILDVSFVVSSIWSPDY